jgi:triosephosphate isomerase
MHWESEGAFTGEISSSFLKEAGCAYVLIGHSERRQYFGETDETVNKKIQAALAAELVPILCIGETQAQRKAGKTEEVLEQQLKKGLQGVPMSDVKPLVVAYEPVWAIGTGITAALQDIEQALHFIHNWLAKAYDAPTAGGIRLLYGGSVSPETSGEMLKVKNVRGLLVGSASLSTDKFLKIISSQGGS